MHPQYLYVTRQLPLKQAARGTARTASPCQLASCCLKWHTTQQLCIQHTAVHSTIIGAALGFRMLHDHNRLCGNCFRFCCWHKFRIFEIRKPEEHACTNAAHCDPHAAASSSQVAHLDEAHYTPRKRVHEPHRHTDCGRHKGMGAVVRWRTWTRKSRQ